MVETFTSLETTNPCRLSSYTLNLHLLYIYSKYVLNTGTCNTPCARWYHETSRRVCALSTRVKEKKGVTCTDHGSCDLWLCAQQTMQCATQATWHKVHTRYSSSCGSERNTTLASRRTRTRKKAGMWHFSNLPNQDSCPAPKISLHETSSRHMPVGCSTACHRHGCLLLAWQVPGLHSRRAVLWCKLRVIIQGRRLQL